MLEKGLSFINENQIYMFVVRNFKNINWGHVDFGKGKSQFLLFLDVYHILSETE